MKRVTNNRRATGCSSTAGAATILHGLEAQRPRTHSRKFSTEPGSTDSANAIPASAASMAASGTATAGSGQLTRALQDDGYPAASSFWCRWAFYDEVIGPTRFGLSRGLRSGRACRFGRIRAAT